MVRNNGMSRADCRANMGEMTKRFDRLEVKIDALEASMNQAKVDYTALKEHFNENLKKAVSNQQTMSRWKLAISISALSAGLSLIISLVLR